MANAAGVAEPVDTVPTADTAGTGVTGTAALPDATILPAAACISLNPRLPHPCDEGDCGCDTRASDLRTAVAPVAGTSAAIASAIASAAITSIYPSRLPRDRPPVDPDGRPATRWTDPAIVAAYAERDDDAEREIVWPMLEAVIRPAQQRRLSGRPDGSVLELGCGLGALAQRLADRSWLRVYAFDVSPAMHRAGSARYRDAWVVRTLPDTRGRVPLRRAQCTAAVAQRVLLHLAHPCLMIGLMADARRVLRPGAPFAVVERDTSLVSPDRERPAEEGAPYTERYRLRDGTTLPTTAWWHSPATIAGCLASAGFTVEEIRPLQAADSLLLYHAKAV